MFNFLDGFEKRMEWMGIANSIINRKGKNTELESLFEENELTNIIVSVLLFIMERTLEENNECELYHIESFLEELIGDYYLKKLSSSQIKDLASYITRDIMQNNGVKLTYALMNYSKQVIEEINIRLISDKIIEENNIRKIVYMLTNQGYEFLFRMREIDEEIQLTIEQLKLKEYIKRKKFSSAVRQSAELINFVRQKKKDIESFILSIRHNIHNVDVEKFELLIKSTYAMLTEEYETMKDIQKMINLADEKIKEEYNLSKDFEDKLSNAKAEIQEINHNIGVIITEQRDLIINRHSLTDLYMDTIKRSFEYSFEKRFDFEEIILSNLERFTYVLDNAMAIIQPLLLPSNKKLMGIGQIFEPQIIYKEIEIQDTHIVNIEEFDATEEKAKIKKISELYVDILGFFLSETLEFKEISLSKLLENLKATGNDDLEFYQRLMGNNCILLTALKLYDLGNVMISEFYTGGGRVIDQPSDEFSLEYCLTKLRGKCKGIEEIKEFSVEKGECEIEVSFEKELSGLNYKETVKMTDLIFRVVA